MVSPCDLRRARASSFAIVFALAAGCGGAAAPAGSPPPVSAGHAHGGSAHVHGGAHVEDPGHASPPPLAHHTGHHGFADAARWAKVFDDPARDAWQQPAKVIELLAIAPGMTVADLGAGTGYFSAHLARAVGPGGKVLALDTEPAMVAYLGERAARERTPNVEARAIAPDDPGLAPGSVDRVLVVNTWHHIADRNAYARKLATALRAGGFIAIVDFTMETAKGPPKHHRVARAAVIEELSRAGLAARHAADLPDQYVVIASAAHQAAK